MWELFPQRIHLTVIVVLTVYLGWIFNTIEGWLGGSPDSDLHSISLIVTLVGTVLAAAAGMLWRRIWQWFPWLGRLIFPDCTGRWEGTLASTWVDPNAEECLAPIPAIFRIRQGLFTTSIRMRTRESPSHSTRCWLEADRTAGRYRFGYVYENEPDAAITHRSPKHEGVAWLEVDLDVDPERMTGRYYTDRRTTGDIDLRRVSKEVR